MNHWLALGIAIVADVVATTALKSTVSLRVLPVGIMYAIWAGAGIVLVALLGWLVYGQRLDMPAITGIACIIAGVVVIQLYSRTVNH